jgi:hypothetical protein
MSHNDILNASRSLVKQNRESNTTLAVCCE